MKKGKRFSGYNGNTPETIEKRRKTMIGQKRSDESKKRMSEAHSGKGWSEKRRQAYLTRYA